MDAASERAPADAGPLLARALAFEGSLRSRTEGLTWALWGIVLALVFLMYAGTGDAEGLPPAWMTLLWIPWVLVGALFTWALWRTAALDVFAGARPAGLAVTLAWVLAIVAGFGVVSLAPEVQNPESTALVAVGLAWLLMGGANLFRATPRGRRSVLLIGGATLGVGLAMVLLLPAPDWHDPGGDAMRYAQDLLRAAVAAAIPLAVGLRQALRG